MTKMNDIYSRVGSKLEEQNFCAKNVEEKKELVDKALRYYLIEKIAMLGNEGVLNSTHKDEVSVIDLVDVLGAMIPEKEHYNTLRHLTHYVINTASVMQGRTIVWYSENDPICIDDPVAIFDGNGFWDSVSTHEDDSYVRSFEFVYDVFVNDFMKKQKVNKKTIMNGNSEV